MTNKTVRKLVQINIELSNYEKFFKLRWNNCWTKTFYQKYA